MSTTPILTFIGGAGTVTGSKTLLDTPSGRVLVDCGLFQGKKVLREQNWDPLPVDPHSIDAVLLTHAHIDHCGHLPRLATAGFRGPVLCTDGTSRLAQIVLPDSGHLHEEEAKFANRKGYSKHSPALPLYTKADAVRTLEQLVAVPFGDSREVIPGVSARWQRAGHILGAASIAIELTDLDRRVVFSGDLGRPSHPLLLPPEPIGAADVIVVESTYGDEVHEDDDPGDILADVITRTVDRGGVVIIPAFAVDRTEVVLWHLDRLTAAGRIPRVPVHVDSPMASRALTVYQAAARHGSPEIRPELHGADLFAAIDPQDVTTVDESKALNVREGPMIVVSASGMISGGRVLHHLAHRLGDARNAVLLVGFQAPGTRGEALRAGAPQIKMLGTYHQVRAEIATVDLSTHADRDELVEWLATASSEPDMVYVNHGERGATAELVGTIRSRLGWPAAAVRQGERVRLDTAT